MHKNNEWCVLSNGILTKDSLDKLKREHQKSIKLRDAYCKSDEYKKLYEEKDNKFKCELMKYRGTK